NALRRDLVEQGLHPLLAADDVGAVVAGEEDQRSLRAPDGGEVMDLAVAARKLEVGRLGAGFEGEHKTPKAKSLKCEKRNAKCEKGGNEKRGRMFFRFSIFDFRFSHFPLS